MPAAPNHDALTKIADTYGGPIAAAVLNSIWAGLAWLVAQADGMTFERWISVAAGLATLWWTIERARTERAKRQVIEGYVTDDRKMWQRLRDRMSRASKLGDL